MAGKLAEPVFINGGDDNLLVGDTAAIVAAEAAAENTAASLSTFEELIPETTKPEKQEELKSDSGKAMAGSSKEVSSSPSGAKALAAVDSIPTNDEDKANEVVAAMKKDGSIDTLEGNTEAIDKLVKATGLEKRLKDVTPSYDEKTYNNKLKLGLLKDYDWSTTACDKSMNQLLGSLSTLFPNVQFGSNADSNGSQAAKDTSLLAALRCGAKWLTDDSYDSILDGYGNRMEGASDNFMKSTLTDFQGNKQVRFVRKAAAKMKDDDGTPATARIKSYNPLIVEEILGVYPWGFMDSFEADIDTAHDELVQALNDIDPDWYKMQRNGMTVNDLTHYYKATDEALYVLGYKAPHLSNVAVVGRYRKISYTVYPQHIKPKV